MNQISIAMNVALIKVSVYSTASKRAYNGIKQALILPASYLRVLWCKISAAMDRYIMVIPTC